MPADVPLPRVRVSEACPPDRVFLVPERQLHEQFEDWLKRCMAIAIEERKARNG